MKKDYLSRLSWAARWWLPRAEGDDVLSDYRELLSQRYRTDAELQRDLGKPSQVIRQLSRPREYHCWCAVFAALTALLLLLPVAGGSAFFTRYSFGLPVLMLAAGLALSFLWFQRRGWREDSLPHGLLPLLLVQAVGLALVWFTIWVCLYRIDDFIRLMEATNGAVSGSTVHHGLYVVVWATAALGIYGLVRARMGDRRWRAVYAAGLTVAVVGLAFLAFLTRMDLSFSGPGWERRWLWQYLIMSVIGVAGTGVSLC